MTKYVKLISKTQIEYPPKNKGSIINYDTNIPQLVFDGYKELAEAQKEIGKAYTITYTESKTQVIEHAEEIPQPDPATIREEQFNRDFFNTSLGYIRRQVQMATGEKKDFLSDLLPTIVMAVNNGTSVNVLTYDEPDFTEEITDWTQYQHTEAVTAQFIQECFLQLQNDFIPVNE